jgi:acetylornithine aminotransferase
VIEAPAGYLEAARDITARSGALLWVDEVQTGIGRTGSGSPTAAAASRPTWSPSRKASAPASRSARASRSGGGRAARARRPRQHLRRQPGRGRRRAGHARRDRARRAARAGHAHRAHLAERLERLGHPLVHSVRGRGLLRAVELTEPCSDGCATGAGAGFIVNATGPTTCGSRPPLILTTGQATLRGRAAGAAGRRCCGAPLMTTTGSRAPRPPASS